MQFKGKSRNCEASLEVGRTLTEKSVFRPYIQLTLTPRISDFSLMEYSIITNNGRIAGQEWHVNKEPIVIKSYSLLPRVSEKVAIYLRPSGKANGEALLLHQVIPDWITISPDQAVRIFVDTYARIYGKYPATNFSYSMEI
jgi:hypothetical protein